jgi:predicted anti-sigma-YlaC factor YlaD
MRMRRIVPADCAQARQQLSLRIDSELSEFEDALLDSHLELCVECRAFGQSVSGFTAELRALPFERPSISFEAPRRRRRVDAVLSRSVQAASAAAAVAVVATSGFLALERSTNNRVAAQNLRNVRAILNLHEQRLQQADTAAVSPVSPGLAAAEGVAPVAPGARAGTSVTHRSTSQGRR